LLGYSAGQPQVNIAGQPQVNTSIQRNTSEIASSGPSTGIKINDSKRRCCVCQSEQHFSSNCPNKIPRVIDASLAGNNDSIDQNLTILMNLVDIVKKVGHAIRNCLKLNSKKQEEETERSRDTLPPTPTEFTF